MAALTPALMCVVPPAYLALVVWVYLDARKRQMNACGWMLGIALFPGVGVFFYAIATGSRVAWTVLAIEIAAMCALMASVALISQHTPSTPSPAP